MPSFAAEVAAQLLLNISGVEPGLVCAARCRGRRELFPLFREAKPRCLVDRADGSCRLPPAILSFLAAMLYKSFVHKRRTRQLPFGWRSVATFRLVRWRMDGGKTPPAQLNRAGASKRGPVSQKLLRVTLAAG